MNRSLLVIIHLFVTLNFSMAQETKVELNGERNTNNSVDINYKKSVLGSYFVVINFTSLTNCYESTTQKVTINGLNGRLLTLKPSDPSMGIGYGYTYKYILGTDNYKANNFVYLLPFPKDTKVKVNESSYLASTYFGEKTPVDWKSYGFYTDEESTITAVRKGIVVSVKDEFDLDTSKSYVYKSSNNELTIEHEDGSFARYSGFKKGSIAVKKGDTVFPETVLGKNSKYSADNKYYSMSFYIFYLKANEFAASEDKRERSFYGFVTPIFFTKEGQETLAPKKEYIAESNPDLVAKEMTRKEVKSFRKG